jgi:uncharacterized Zn-finger protein
MMAGATETGFTDMSMEPPETIEVESNVVACDGGEGPLGHPRVYLNMGAKRDVECPYCGRRFVLKDGVKVPAGH